MVRKIVAKKRLKKLLDDELHQIEEEDWLSKIDDQGIDFFAENCEKFFPVTDETDLLEIAHKVIPITYRNAKMFKRHRIISDDVEMAFIITTNRNVHLKNDDDPH